MAGLPNGDSGRAESTERPSEVAEVDGGDEEDEETLEQQVRRHRVQRFESGAGT